MSQGQCLFSRILPNIYSISQKQILTTLFYTQEGGRGGHGRGDLPFETQACISVNYAKAWVEYEVNKGKKVGGARSSPEGKPKGAAGPRPHQRFPAEDVTVEADPVFGEVESALKKNVSLECTRVICGRTGAEELRHRQRSLQTAIPCTSSRGVAELADRESLASHDEGHQGCETRYHLEA